MDQNAIWMIQGTDYKENTKHLLEAADLETEIKKKNGENKNCKIGVFSVFASFIQLTGYGSGFLRAWWQRCVCGKDSFSAFEKTFYK